ncbi:type II toxin-antitoxin system VapC family toxin [Candidatus Poriferisodalis sp.]|uniref:type II toxin-antitoxin system VapC family toxin n=1 Tax=Candidatus Poriferisodalis sp. TaxID=3101277 RepID=UPI003B0163A0
MKTRPVRAYLDANVLIAYVANENGRAGIVQSVLDDARDEKIELFTSVLSITEVAFVTTGQPDDPAGGEDAIDQLWVPASPIHVLDISIRIAREARAIIRKSKSLGTKTVKPADAIHLASASIHDCDRVFTYENQATRHSWAELISLTVAEPFLDEPRLDVSG